MTPPEGDVMLACGHYGPAGSDRTRWCPDCLLWLEEDRARRAAARQERAARRRAGSGIPPRYHGRTLVDLGREGWPMDLILCCATWCEQGGGLYVHGDVGTGKTTAAAAAAYELVARRRVEWVKAPRLARWASASFGTPEHEAAQRIAGADTALVMDDLGAEHVTDHVATVIFEAIEARMDAGAPLLITSNLPIGAACARHELYGQRLASRIHEYCHVVAVSGPDHRLRP